MPADTINRQLRGSFYRRNRLAFALAAAGALMGAVLNLIISWLMQQLIDTAAGTSGALPFRILVRACGGFFLLLFCGSAFVYCAKPRFLATAMEQYKNCAVTQLTQKSVPDFQRRPSAAYLSALTNDAAAIEADYLTQQFTLIQKLFCFAGALALMLTYSLPLTLAAIVLSMLPFAVSMAAGNRLSDAACRVSDRNRDFTAFLSDYLNGFPVIRSFRAEDEINQRFASENHRLEQQKCTRLKLQTLLESAGTFTGITAQLGIFLLGTWLALTGRGVTPGVVIAFVNLMNFIIEPIAALPGLLAAPCTPLSPDWISACDDGGPEGRLAAALASLRCSGKLGPFRAHLSPVAPHALYRWEDTSDHHVPWRGETLEGLGRMFLRRLVLAQRYGEGPLRADLRMSPADLLPLLDGRLDVELLRDLLRAFSLVGRPQRLPEAWCAPLRQARLPHAVALLKLLYTPLPQDAGLDRERLRPEQRILRLVQAGRLAEACALAAQRLRIAGGGGLYLPTSFAESVRALSPAAVLACLAVPVDGRALLHQLRQPS